MEHDDGDPGAVPLARRGVVVPILRAWLRRTFGLRPSDAELAAELQAHVDMHADDVVHTGVAADEARRRAVLDLGGVAATRESQRDAVRPCLESVVQDLRHAARILRRSPSFTLTAILAMTIGIGVTALVFSVVNALAFRPPAVADPAKVVFVQVEGERQTYPHSYPAYRDIAERNTVFDATVAYGFTGVPFETGSSTSRAYMSPVSGNYFRVFGLAPAMGRLIDDQDDRPGSPPVVVLSWDSWQADFQGQASAVGRTVRIGRVPHTVVGVAPKGFHGLEVTMRPRFWTPLRSYVGGYQHRRESHVVFVVGRLREGVSRDQAAANLNAITAALGREFPKTDAEYRVRVTDPGWLGDGFARPIQAFATGVLLLASLVLFTACANVATALAVHTLDRHREIAIRMSLGAGRFRLVRLVILEALILASLGGVLAIVLTRAGTEALSAWWLPIDVPTQVDVRPDWSVVLAAGAAVVLAVLTASVGPVRLMLRLQPNQAMKGGTGWALAGRVGRVRGALVGLQVSLCCVLVAAALVSAVGLRRAMHVPVGYDGNDLRFATLDFSAAGYAYDQTHRANAAQRALQAVRSLPGVTQVAFSSGAVPLGGNAPYQKVYPQAKLAQSASLPMALSYRVSEGFLETMGIPLLAGRTLAATDQAGQPYVAVVNQAFVRQVLETTAPIGHKFHLNALTGPTWEVVGVVPVGKYESISETPKPAIFLPVAQAGYDSIRLVARVPGARPQFLERLRQTLSTLDPGVPVLVDDSESASAWAFFPIRMAVVVLSSLAVVALLLAANGLYGAFAYVVASREREIGLRVALGAGSVRVLRGILGPVALVTAVGVGLGVGGALGLSQVLDRIVPLARPQDPIVLVLLIAVMGGVATLAMAAPAFRSLRVSPVVALKAE